MPDILSDAYAIFCRWCDDHGHRRPTLEQFYTDLTADYSKPTDLRGYQREIDRERREGWMHDPLTDRS